MSQPRTIAIIPARLASSRFPRKVLAKETGKFLIQHVWERVRGVPGLSQVLIATDSGEVASACNSFGAEVILTREDHPNGSSRLEEAATAANADGDDYIINVQGDEPEVEPAAILAAVAMARSSGAEVATIAHAIDNPADFANPNIVKVVLNVRGEALYFSRSPIPHVRASGGAAVIMLRHVGLYVYRAAFLKTYVTLKATPLEAAESLEQLRVLEHGFRIAVARHEPSFTKSQRDQGFGTGIDTPEQYAAFVARYSKQARESDNLT